MNTPAATKRRIEIYDTTLRDGTQGEGVNLSLVDKIKITQLLDSVGVDYVEGGYPLSNPKDEAYFQEVRKLDLKYTKVCAFGMTRRKDIDPKDDAGMQALVGSGSPIITIVGKTWDLHVDEVLRISREENLAMITDSLAFCLQGPDTEEVFYDAEHFFDGYRANPEYALATLKAALKGGATRLVLCDTNGGSMPGWISETMRNLYRDLGADVKLAIHTHNDAGLAVANSLAAVEVGAVQVQGTINGIGERCGNVDLTTVIANLRLKLGYDCLTGENLDGLTKLSRAVYERANLSLSPCQPYVGTSAFAHKGGMHVHAVQRIAHSYEHVEPSLVGNERRILVSELSGASNISATLGEKFSIQDDKELQRKVLQRVQDLEHQGYHFEAAQASFELLLYDAMGKLPDFWELDHYRCVILRRRNEKPTTEATVKLRTSGHTEHRVAEGDGPVNALDAALRKALKDHYPQINNVHLTDYKVRVVNPTAESAAKVRVIAEFAVRDNKNDDDITRYITTIGVNENIVDASWQAIADAFRYHLVETTAPVRV